MLKQGSRLSHERLITVLLKSAEIMWYYLLAQAGAVGHSCSDPGRANGRPISKARVSIAQILSIAQLLLYR